MGALTGSRIVHSYDVATHRIRCGVPEQSSSTKHASGVTCPTCRELLLGAPRAVARFDGAADPALGR
jgi:hypothetical protein